MYTFFAVYLKLKFLIITADLEGILSCDKFHLKTNIIMQQEFATFEKNVQFLIILILLFMQLFIILPCAAWDAQREKGDFTPEFSSTSFAPFVLTLHPSPHWTTGMFSVLMLRVISFSFSSIDLEEIKCYLNYD